MKGIIYLHTNKINGKVYVGQTHCAKPIYRWGPEGSGYKRTPHFSNAIKKYGWSTFDHQVVAHADTQEGLNNLEKAWIILLRPMDRNYGYNSRSGGDGGVCTEERRVRMSAAHKGRPTWNKGLHGVQIGWNKGLKCPWVAEYRQNYVVSEITREKMRRANKVAGNPEEKSRKCREAALRYWGTQNKETRCAHMNHARDVRLARLGK